MSLIEEHATVFKTDSQQGPTIGHRELYSVLLGSPDRSVVEGGWIHVAVWLSGSAMHLKLLQYR